MNKVAILITAVAIVLVVVAGIIAVSNDQIAVGSIETGQEYNATTTVGMATGFVQLKSLPGSVGSVVVASSSADVFRVWNATSTSDTASSSPIQFIATPGQGTYTFDATFERGIILELGAGSNGSYTVTWR